MAAVSKSLTKDDLGCVVEALTPVKHKWEVIGLQIGVRSHVLEAIKLEHSRNPGRNPGRCLLAVLKEHLSKVDPQPCWEGFVKALRSESVGETASAEALRLKFCPNEPLSEVQSPECSTSDEVTSPVSTSASEQNQFPFLKLPAEMSEDARETLYGRLSTEHREMQWKFQRLVSTTWKGVAEKGITPKELSNEICCQSYESQIKNEPQKLLSDCQEEIRKSESIDDAFFIMRNHYSFFNYELIEGIIMIFDLDRSHLSAFEEELRRFCERRVHEFPAKAYGTAMSTDSKLTVVLDSEFDKYTMNSLRSFRHRLGKIFKVSSAVIRLIEVYEGSIEIVFAIPSSLVDQILPLSEEQEKSLRDEGVKHFEFKHPPNSFMAKPKGTLPTTPADSGEQLAETKATRDDSGTACIDQEERITSGKLHLKVQLGDVSAKSELLVTELGEWKARCLKLEDDRTELADKLKQAEARVKDVLETIDQEFAGRVHCEEDEGKKAQIQLFSQNKKLEHTNTGLERDRRRLSQNLAGMTKERDAISDLLKEAEEEAVKQKRNYESRTRELSQKLKELDALRKRGTQLAEELGVIKLEAATYKEDFETERREREEIASAMVEQKAKMELQYQRLKEECDTTLEANIQVSERLEKEVQILEKLLEDKASQVEAALKEKNSNETEHQYEIKIATAKEDSLNDEIRNLTAKHQQLETKLKQQSDKLNGQIVHLDGELEVTCQHLAGARADITGLEEELAGKTQQVKHYFKQVEDQKREIATLQSQGQDQHQQYEILWGEADNSKQRVTNLRGQLQKRLEEIEQLHQEIKRLHQDHQDYLDYVTAQQKSDMLNARYDKRDIMREKEQLKLELEHLTKWMQQAGFSVDPATGALPVPRKPHPPATDSVAMLSSRANQDRTQDRTQLGMNQPRGGNSLKNPLEAGITTDIHNVAAEFGEEYEPSSLLDVPLDPNLVCPMCGLPFRIGEIQKFKTHVQNCKGASSSDSSHPQHAERPLADSRRQSDCHSKHPDSGFMSGMHSREYSSPHKHPDSGFMSGMRSQNVSAEVDSRTHKSTK